MEQQRRFIYLRQTGNGRESGYARLENKDGAWKLSVVVQGFPQDATATAGLWLNGEMLTLGMLHFDNTGRGGMTANVFPADIADSSLLAIVREENGQKTIPLAAVPGHGAPISLDTVLSALNPPMEASAESEPEAIVTPVAEASKPSADPDLEAIKETENAIVTPLTPEKEGRLPEKLRAVYWPQHTWPMVDLFERFPEVPTPGGQENRICVQIPLNGLTGAPDHYLLGAETENGQVTALGMLLPGDQNDAEYSSLPDYVWAEGYWQFWQPVSE